MKASRIGTIVSISKFLLAVSCCALAFSCKKATTNIQAAGQTDKFAGVWQGEVKLIGGQGLAEVNIELNHDKTFVMKVGVGEKANFLNAYPTLDRIRMVGKWSTDGNSEILLDGKVEDFARMQLIGDAARQGFLADDKRGSDETRFVPLPFEEPQTLRVRQDGGLLLDMIEFRGREADESDDDFTSRMIINVNLDRVAD